MRGLGYSYVTDQGFASFGRELDAGPWKDVAIKKYDAEDQIAKTSLLSAPQPAVWKLRIAWALRSLLAALGLADDEVLARLDADWDAAQRAYSNALLAGTDHEEQAHRDAAGRLRKATTLGKGTAQNRLRYDQEFDFGLKQLQLTQREPLAADVALLGVEGHLARIEKTTTALGKGLGREPGKNRGKTRSKQIRAALGVCSAAFNTVHDEIAWMIEHSPAGEERARLEAMLAPFQALLERYPAGSVADDEGGAEEGGADDEGGDASEGEEPGPADGED